MALYVGTSTTVLRLRLRQAAKEYLSCTFFTIAKIKKKYFQPPKHWKRKRISCMREEKDINRVFQGIINVVSYCPNGFDNTKSPMYFVLFTVRIQI